MNEFTLNMFKGKLEKISDELRKKDIPSDVLNPEEDVVFLLTKLPIKNNIAIDTQLYYIPLDDEEPFERFLLQMVSSFDITEQDIPMNQLQIICDAVNLRSPIGTLFIDPDDKSLYCRHSIVETNEFTFQEIFDITFEIYIMTLSMTNDLISRLLN